MGDIFSVRIAGNVISPNVLASMEYGCAVAGAKLILIMGHTRCGAVTSALDLACTAADPKQATGCEHLEHIVKQIQNVIDPPTCQSVAGKSDEEKIPIVDEVARRNVMHIVGEAIKQSGTIRKLIGEGRIAVAGAIYDVASGKIDVITGPIGAAELAQWLNPDGQFTERIPAGQYTT